jgi:fructose-bisphosphate aldolase, class I
MRIRTIQEPSCESGGVGKREEALTEVSEMNAQELIDTARQVIADDKALLAMDESNPTCNKRFARSGIP